MMTLEIIDFFSNQYYVHIRGLLSVVALWPFKKPSKQLIYIFLISAMMAIAIVFQTYLLSISERKVETISDLLQTLLPAFIIGAAYWNLLYNSALVCIIFLVWITKLTHCKIYTNSVFQVKETLERVKNDWNRLTCKDELSIMQTYAAQSKVCSQLIACAFCIYTAYLIIPSIIRFFLYILGIIDKTKITLPVYDEVLVINEVMYLTMFPLELIIISTACVIGITNYSMFISFLQHACALFIIVTYKIDRLFIKNEYKLCWTQTNSKCRVESEWIVAVVQDYNNAIKFVELITLLYGKMYVLEVSLALSFIIIDFIYIFQFLSLTITLSKAIQNSLYIIGSMLMICGYTYIMQRLTDHSNNVYAQCRLISFYKLSIKTNKLLLQLITQTMKSYTFSVKGIIVASHEDFVKLMKTSFSFAFVCHKMY